tara:strand:- start:139 stop:642 length:504 start_codon:yes stop_codon:yes gene_type:complete
MMPIFLIGYMGSGKSTIGRNLSARMNLNFIDLDEVIEAKLGMTINEIFSCKGEVFFREKEHSILTQFDFGKNLIVAVGGGTPCFFGNHNFMNSIGITIYLKVSCGELFNRLQSNTNRPLLLNNRLTLQDVIITQMMEREKYYQTSQYIIDSDNISVNQVYDLVNKII